MLSGSLSHLTPDNVGTSTNDDSGGAHYQVMLAGETNYLTTYNDDSGGAHYQVMLAGETNYLTTYNDWRCPLSGDVSR